jgi:hypothetical protein
MYYYQLQLLLFLLQHLDKMGLHHHLHHHQSM